MSAPHEDLFDVYTRALDDWFKTGKNVVPICIVAGLVAMFGVSWLAAFASSLNIDPPQQFAPTPTLKAKPPAAGASPSKKVDAEADVVDPREEGAPSFAAVAADDGSGRLKRRR